MPLDTGIDIAGIDHYPSTWTNEGGGLGTDWGPLESLVAIINNWASMGDGRPLKGAIIETGFTTCENAGLFHNENRQRDWINNALPIIRTKVSTQYTANYNQRIVLLSWYTLLDTGFPFPTCTLSNPVDIYVAEQNFGIVRANSVPKLGYPDLKAQVLEYPYL